MKDMETALLAYVDGELDPEQAREIERLIESDPRAQEKVRTYRETAALLRAACAEPFYRDVPPRLKEALRKPRSPVPGRAIMAIAASLLLAMVGFAVGYGVGSAPPSQYDALVDDISEYHGVFARDASHLVEVPASHMGEMQDWFRQEIGRTLSVPDLSKSGFEFAGGRLYVVRGRPVAQLLYTKPGTLPIGICVTALAETPERLRLTHRGDLNLASWREGAYTYVVVGDLPDREMRDLAATAAAAFQG
jgi:anti-sigma factor RsiW